MADLTEHEKAQVNAAQESGRTPVVFVHGLWLLPNSWDRWRAVFEDAGYTTLAPGWPDDPKTVAEAKAHPEVFAKKTVGQIADHFEDVIGKLTKRPAVIGHSFGGLLAQILGGSGRLGCDRRHRSRPVPRRAAAADLRTASRRRRCSATPRTTTVRFRSRTSSSATRSPTPSTRTRRRSSTTRTRCRDRARRSSRPRRANLNPWTEAKVKSKNPERGPLLIMDGEQDHTVPWAIANASFKKQKRNEGVTEIVKVPGRGHSLTIDHGWRDVADLALAFVQRFVKP